MAGAGNEARGWGVRGALPLLLAALIAACAPRAPEVTTPWAPMPEPHANNAVAAVERDGRTLFYSFMGLKAGKTHEDISTAAFEYDVAADRWRRINPVPAPEGRLASVAVALGGRIYLFGGYTVAADGSEVSTPDVWRYDPETGRYARLSNIPKPVDDSVALAYADRYIYLVSGWHMDGNVSNVQVYDTKDDIWFNATDFPGSPVFGHAGGIVGDRMVVIDGVAVLGHEPDGGRKFGVVRQTWVGEINPDDPSLVDWREAEPHGGPPVYRAAATGVADMGVVLFAGGAHRAYNFTGIGYDGEPAEPQTRIFGYDPFNDVWMGFADKSAPSMDHRGLLAGDGAFWTVGGLTLGQRVTGIVDRFEVRE